MSESLDAVWVTTHTPGATLPIVAARGTVSGRAEDGPANSYERRAAEGNSTPCAVPDHSGMAIP